MFCIILTGWMIHPLAAMQPVIIDERPLTGRLIGHHLEILEDKDYRYTIHDIVRPAMKNSFSPATVDVPAFGYTPSAYWVRFQVFNKATREISWYLSHDYFGTNQMELYIPEGNGFRVRKGGNENPRCTDVQDVRFIFAMKSKPGISTYYIRYYSMGSMIIPLSIWSNEPLHGMIKKSTAAMTAFFAILAVMLIFNLFIFLSTRERRYLYYVLNNFFLMFQSLLIDGYAYVYLFDINDFWQGFTVPCVVLSALTGNLFSRAYLETARNTPLFDRMILRPLFWILSLDFLIFIPAYFTFRNWPAFIANLNSISIILVLISITSALFLGIIYVVRRNRAGYFYGAAYSLLLVGASLLGLKDYNIIPTTMVTLYGYHIGLVSMLIVFSIGLADQINRMRKELGDLNANLEQKVDQRTEELQATMQELQATMEELEAMNESLIDKSSELEQVNARLTELDRLKSNFVANVSHEIRTPLTLILSPVESYLQGDYAKGIDESFFQNINKNGIRLLKLINNLLDFSKIDAGRMTLSVREADIRVFLANYVEVVRPTADSRRIDIAFEDQAHAHRLWFDLEKMDKVVMNLLSNALKFTEEGGSVRVVVRDDENSCIIEFIDTGIGIPEDKITTVFDRFSQVDASSIRKYEGTGIGLSLARELIEMHGGTIQASSSVADDSGSAHGTVMTIRIPRGRSHFEGRPEVNIVENSELRDSVSDVRGRRFSGMRELHELKKSEFGDREGTISPAPHRIDILVVEDNPDMANFISFLLSDRYQVHLAPNGKEGLYRARQIRPDLIVTDVMMPEMDGYTMTRELKKNDELKHIPVIMLTAKFDISQKIEGLEYGADDYLIKPFNSKELLTRIRSLLKTHQYQRIISERNREIEGELAIGRAVLMKLLPASQPPSAQLDLYASYIPCDTLGGDLYDYFKNGNDNDFFIADVAGHGVSAAFFAIITKISLLNFASGGQRTGSVLRQLNEIIHEYMVRMNYVTAFYCKIDLARRRIVYSNAGHYYPLLHRRDTNQIIELKAKGMPLGWDRAATYEERELALADGDRIILFTDGIVECRKNNELFGDRRLHDLVRANRKASPRVMTERVIQALRDFSGGVWFEDDVTMIVIDIFPERGVVL